MPDVIYHYTSNDVLLKMLGEKSLRLSSRHHLNDSMEGEQFFSLLKTHASQPKIEKLAEIRRALDPFEFFVTCFSSHGDLLSQWRGYAGNGTGVAIGFRKQAFSKAIKRSHEALLYTVAYVDDLQNLPTDRAKTINAMLTSPAAPGQKAIQSFAKERWAIKPKGFAEEQESRLIVTIDSRSGALKPATKGLQIGYFATASEVREFCVFRFGDFENLTFIESITLGPNNRTSEDALRRYLEGVGMSEVKIGRSAITYR